jgi:molecular chaperone DnaK
MLHVAVDFGTSSTCTVVSVDGRPPQVVVVDGAPLIPSAVYVTADGTLFVGHEAERQAAMDPSRYEPHPKRRIDEPELLLGDAVLPVVGVIRAVLRRALQEARHLAGGAPADRLVLTHPADWGAARTQKLRRSAHGLAGELVLVPEPVAAAVFHAQGHAVPQGGCLAVLDLGGGTVDASVVRRLGMGFHVLSARGDPTFGGADIDQALLEHVGAQVAAADPDAWRRLVQGRELTERRRRRVLHQDVRGAKETLSRHAYADIPMPPPFADAHVTRDDLERLIAAPMQRTIALLATTIAEAGLRPEQLVGVFLVGGSSRIPMVSRLVHERLGVVPVALDQPETVVARGALHAALAKPETHPPVSYGRPAGAGGPYGGGQHGGGQYGGGSGFGQLPPVRPAGPVPPARPAFARPGAPAGVPGAAADPAASAGTVISDNQGAPGSRRQSRNRRSRVPWLVGGAVVTVAVAITLAVALKDRGQHIADYHYWFAVPQGWHRSGGSQDARQVELSPTDASARPDRIIVREYELVYDADADRDRAVNELRTEYDRTRAATTPPTVEGFESLMPFAGRDVVHYSEAVDAGSIDWYVLFGGHYEVSVGCQHDDSGAARVRAACEQVVGSTKIVPG